jgi:phosphatidylglycerophosphate synthase
MSRRNAEHWLARLLLRRISLPVTRELLRTPVTANQLTGLMIVVGLLAAGAAATAGLAWALVAFLLVQVYFLLDLCDGEVARWRRSTSITGVYLDRVGHYLVEAALLCAYGFRAGGQELGGWSTLGVAAGLFAVLVKAETDLVDVARVRSGHPRTPDDDEAVTPRSPTLGALRRAGQMLKIHQLTGALESSFLLLVAAVVDAATDTLHGSQVLAAAMFGIAAVMTLLHLVSVLASRRLAP